MSPTPVLPPAGVDGPRGGEVSHRAGVTRRLCAWCEGPIPARARRDAVCCSTRCRQARHRFTRTLTHRGPTAGADGGRAGGVGGGRPRRLAYADPPYPGNAHLDRGHPDYAGEVDHATLIQRLQGYDGWALSTSARALPAVLALCPPGVRVAAWHRGPRPTRSRHPLSAWEPVIYHGHGSADTTTIDPHRADSLVHGVAPMTTLPGRVIGAKPAAFCRWLFALLAADLVDSFEDLFPGSGAVTRAWAAFTGRPHPSPEAAGDASPEALPEVLHEAPAPAGHDASAPAAAAVRDASGTPASATAPAGEPGSRRVPLEADTTTLAPGAVDGAVRELNRIAATSPDLGMDRHVVQDIADHLAGRTPDPGSPFAGAWPSGEVVAS
jgi:hypothetical protein